jgi:hypothetical protein
MVLRAGFKKKLRLYVELKIYDKNRQKITGPQCVKSKTSVAQTASQAAVYAKGLINWGVRT